MKGYLIVGRGRPQRLWLRSQAAVRI